jgi:hypothetical protein
LASSIAEEWFSVKGCEKLERSTLTSLTCRNFYEQHQELHFDTEEETTRWQNAIEANAKQIARSGTQAEL